MHYTHYTYPKAITIFSVNPVTAAAIANIKVVSPKDAWIGTSAVLNPAVAPSQHNRIRKLKNPITNWKKSLVENVWK